MLLCQNCDNKVFTDGKDLTGLIEIPTAPIPKKGDGKDKTTQNQIKKIKCPKCGYVFRVVKLAPEKSKEEDYTKIEEELMKGQKHDKTSS